MTAQMNPVLHTVVLPSPDSHPSDTPTRRLLGQLGHEVARASSPDHALELLSTDHTDLLVIDVANQNSNRELLSLLAGAPESIMPAEVAIYTDAVDSQLREMSRHLSASKVHLFVKPLHMHGLLSVLRQMERGTTAGAV
jgi:CheY-like chemotaxis protein